MVYYVVVGSSIYEFDTQGKALAYASKLDGDFYILIDIK
jgi:hypothetical protein